MVIGAISSSWSVAPSVRRPAPLVNVDHCQYDRRVIDERWLTAQEATAAFGVKPQTLYAYVSRGLVRRERPPGSRTSRYARSDVERLAEHGRPRVARARPRS